MSASTTTERPHTTGDHGQTDFDAIAAEYDDSLPHHVMDHYLDKRVEFIRRYVAPGSAILDVGCGTGVLAKRLAAKGYAVTGMDPFDGMLAYLRQRAPEIHAVQGRGEQMPFADNTFDLAYCVAVMHHVADPQDVHDTLKEMVRVTRPGGHILVWDHNPRNPYWPLLMKRVPQDTGAERLIPEKEILDGLTAGGAWPMHVEALGLMPDFTPKSLVPVMAKVEALVEHTPLVNRLCAHNVILAVKGS
ncbi:MAG: methyltransferase domain-containing protein [Thermomicrobiales bacterium]